MASAGFSAPVNYFYLGSALAAILQPVSSNDNKTISVAEALNSYGDAVVCDSFGEVMAPSVDYIVCNTLDLSALALGLVVNNSETGKKFMITTVTVTTQAGQPPRVTISGVEVESSASNRRRYALSGTLLPRSKAQDVCGAFASSDYLTQATTTFSVDAHLATKAGLPKFSDASHGRVEVSVTQSKPSDSVASLSLGSNGFVLSSAVTATNPDGDYISESATAMKPLTGAEPGSVNASLSAPPSSGDGDSGDGDSDGEEQR